MYEFGWLGIFDTGNQCGSIDIYNVLAAKDEADLQFVLHEG